MSYEVIDEVPDTVSMKGMRSRWVELAHTLRSVAFGKWVVVPCANGQTPKQLSLCIRQTRMIDFDVTIRTDKTNNCIYIRRRDEV